MRANAIMFANPTPKIHNTLPPPRSEMDEVLAFIFTGPAQPVDDDFKRTPLLVSHNRVSRALEWLKLNHSDYHDLTISYENLKGYNNNSPPVVVSYHPKGQDTDALATSLHFNGDEEGTETGPCPLVVHGVTGTQLYSKSIKALKALAMKHLTSSGKVMAVGHAEEPESMYNNPQLYPQMFPWLFPYGLGGLGNVNCSSKISEKLHKQQLLMYHDK
ncbi:hypothetical protein OE88DRAFT_1608708, partial [Heliocybe sulcata]